MTIDEAIKILEAFLNRLGGAWFGDLIAAIKLGIEALKRIKELRHIEAHFSLKELPGETKD